MEKKFTDLKPNEVDYVLVKTSSGGPFIDDVVFLIYAQGYSWQVPNSAGEEVLNWLQGFPHVNLEEFIKSMGCTEDRIFILYRGPEHPVLSEKNKEGLKARLLNFLRENFSASSEAFQKIAEDIFNSYAEDSRFYHTLEHIQNSIWELDQLPEQDIDKKCIELAIWYHDVVYAPFSKTNEEDSAKKMKSDLGALSPKIDLEQVYQMILCTPAMLKKRNLTKSEQYFLDIDFSILGQPAIEYLVYQQHVRLEYQAVPYLTYHLKRKAFLKSTLKRNIFQTEWFKNRYEEQAILNIKSELAKMPYKLLPTLSWK